MLLHTVILIITSNILFLIGFVGLFLFSLRSSFFILVSIEILFLSININFFFYSLYIDNFQGLFFIFFIIIISAVEIVIFLSFFVVFYRKLYFVDSIKNYKTLKH